MPYILCELSETVNSLSPILPEAEDSIVYVKTDEGTHTVERIKVDEDRNLILECYKVY